jgi:3-oxoacyl-[acyl-carrier-protein] synthase III
MTEAILRAIDYHVPERVLTNAELASQHPEWPADRIEEKLGIVERHIAAEGECASDLAVKAAMRLFSTGVCSPREIDYLLFCTQSPDYFLPTSACLIQARLGIPESSGAIDFNLGCSGFIYGLGLAKGLIETGQSKNLLLLTADTYSKFLHPEDKSVRTLFGDGAAATLIQACRSSEEGKTAAIGPFVLGTDGRGARNLIVEAGALRKREASDLVTWDDNGNPRGDSFLSMDGGEIFSFTLDRVPAAVSELLAKSGKNLGDIDLFVFHQANKYMLNVLQNACGISKDRFYTCLRHFGNTVSSTIPIALKTAADSGILRPGATVMLVGFGVGYSWGATLIRWGNRCPAAPA